MIKLLEEEKKSEGKKKLENRHMMQIIYEMLL